MLSKTAASSRSYTTELRGMAARLVLLTVVALLLVALTVFVADYHRTVVDADDFEAKLLAPSVRLVAALHTELNARIVATAPSATSLSFTVTLQAAGQADVNAALADFSSGWSAAGGPGCPACGPAAVGAGITQLRSATSLAAAVEGTSAAAAAVVRSAMGGFVSSTTRAAPAYAVRLKLGVIQMVAAARGELVTLMGAMHQGGGFVDADTAAAAMRARASLETLLLFSDLPGETFSDQYAPLVALARNALTEFDAMLGTAAFASGPVSLTVAQLRSAAEQPPAMLTAAAVSPASDINDARAALAATLVALGVVIVCLGLSLAVVLMQWQRSRYARRLVQEFSDGAKVRELARSHAPVLEELRVKAAPPMDAQTDLGRVYAAAVGCIAELRPLLPQTLFGGISAPQPPAHGAPFVPEELGVRLETGLGSGPCTIMTVVYGNDPRVCNGMPESVQGFSRRYNAFLAATVEAVNAREGVIHTVEPNGAIVAAWGVTHVAEDAAERALQTARVILGVSAEVDVNIVSGSCLASNSKIVARKEVLVIGSVVDTAERVFLLNALHATRIAVDFETFQELGPESQAQCKPIAVFQSADTARTLVYSADGTSWVSPEQAKEYAAAFALYQSGLHPEAHRRFQAYLEVYPHDTAAQWLVESILANKTDPARMHQSVVADVSMVRVLDRP